MADTDITVIGGGVVGLAIAARLSARGRRTVLLERNHKYGMETSSRNSEVIHAGIYYPPGSLRARLCVEGRDELYAVCRAHDIPHRQLTKIITAVDESELPKLDALFRNGRLNDVPLERLDANATRRLEPNVRSAGSVLSPLTGILSVHALMDLFYHTVLRNGGIVQHHARVVGVNPSGEEYAVDIQEPDQRSTVTSSVVVNAAGLAADEIAAMAGIDVDKAGYRLHWARGSYFAVTPSKWRLVSRLVYPVPRNEGLGVHALLDVGGRLRFGPDVEYLAVREQDYRVPEEKRARFGEAVRRIVPAINNEDLTPDTSGIRAKLQPEGGAPRDFVIAHETERGLRGFVNLIGIDSPGLTASPAIARYVEQLLQ
jgi:L-2-hydroxyglutarate oxidase LhgO